MNLSRLLRLWVISEFLLDVFAEAFPKPVDTTPEFKSNVSTLRLLPGFPPVSRRYGSSIQKRGLPFYFHHAPSTGNDKNRGKPDLRLMQRYFLPARRDGGMDIWFAHQYLKGALGEDVRIFDIGTGWLQNHVDLPAFRVLGHMKAGDRAGIAHGTHVAGVLVGRENGIGIDGIVPNATFVGISMYTDPNSYPSDVRAFWEALKYARPGDVILASTPQTLVYSYRHLTLPRDFDPEQFAVVRAATDRGVIVVLPAGEGSIPGGVPFEDDDILPIPPQVKRGSKWSNPWKLGNPWSGAIIVGAGLGTGHATYAIKGGSGAFTPLEDSNYGARIDVQAPGENITTTTTLFGAEIGIRHAYRSGVGISFTDTFGGTAGAAAIIAGIIASVQGILKEERLEPLNSDDFRALFRDPTLGLARVYHPKEKGWVGIQPNMRKLVPQAVYRARAKRDGELKDATRFFGDGRKPHLQVSCFKEIREFFGDRAKEFCTPDSGLVYDGEPFGGRDIW